MGLCLLLSDEELMSSDEQVEYLKAEKRCQLCPNLPEFDFARICPFSVVDVSATRWHSVWF